MWVDNIKVDLRQIGCGVVDWISLAQDEDTWRGLVKTVMTTSIAHATGC
jgi:hypothetical protein